MAFGLGPVFMAKFVARTAEYTTGDTFPRLYREKTGRKCYDCTLIMSPRTRYSLLLFTLSLTRWPSFLLQAIAVGYIEFGFRAIAASKAKSGQCPIGKMRSTEAPAIWLARLN